MHDTDTITHGTETTAFRVPPPDPELKRLEPLLGTWTAEEHTLDSVLGPGVPVRSTETFHWLDGGYFFVHGYETVFGDEPAQTGVSYWFYDSEADRFRITFFSNNRPLLRGRRSLRGPRRRRRAYIRRPGAFPV